MYASSKNPSDNKLSDKELEMKLQVLKEILDFKFKIPPNIYTSIFETITTILVVKVDLSKDFLVLKVLSVLDSLCDAQNAPQALLT